MDEFEIIKQKDRYDELSASNKQALMELCDNEQSFAQIKSLMQHAEGALPVPSPAHVHEQLLTLYDTTYPVQVKRIPKSIPLYGYVVAAAAVVLLVLLIYPITQNGSNPQVAKKGNENKPALPQAKDTTDEPIKRQEEKPHKSNPQPLIAEVETPSTIHQEDIENIPPYNDDLEKEPKPVAASISHEPLEDIEVSKTETAAMDVKQEMLTSKYIAAEVADRKDKSKSAKSKKWVTPSMLKNIRAVF